MNNFNNLYLSHLSQNACDLYIYLIISITSDLSHGYLSHTPKTVNKISKLHLSHESPINR